MSLPLLPAANPASGTPPMGDRANAVTSGVFTGVGVSAPFSWYGAFNVWIWPSITGTLALQGGSGLATITTTGGATFSNGDSIFASNLPTGALILASTVNVGGVTSVTIGGLSTAQIAALPATSATATISGIGVLATATVNFERSFDGGNTWLVCNIGGSGAACSYQFGSGFLINPVSFVCGEPELNTAYRFSCPSYASGSINYRASTSGLLAMPFGVPIG